MVIEVGEWLEMLQQKGRFYPFFLTNFRRKHQDALPPKSVGQKNINFDASKLIQRSIWSYMFGEETTDFENNRWYIRSFIAIKVDIYIVKIGVVCTATFVNQLWLLVSICSHRF